MPFERQESWAVPPRPAHGPLGLLFKKFVAFLWQIAPIVPVLPTHPIYKPFAVNKMLAKRYLDTAEVPIPALSADPANDASQDQVRSRRLHRANYTGTSKSRNQPNRPEIVVLSTHHPDCRQASQIKVAETGRKVPTTRPSSDVTTPDRLLNRPFFCCTTAVQMAPEMPENTPECPKTSSITQQLTQGWIDS